MKNLAADATTAKQMGLFALHPSETSSGMSHASGIRAQYSFRSEVSSTASLVVRSAAIEDLRKYEAYVRAGVNIGESTFADIPSMLVLQEKGRQNAGRTEPLAVAGRNDAAIALLESWLAAPEGDDDDDELAAFMQSIDEDRLSARKLFP
jgi:hypothetical protein